MFCLTSIRLHSLLSLINILLHTGKLNSASSNIHGLELVLKTEKSPMVELKVFILLHLNNIFFCYLYSLCSCCNKLILLAGAINYLIVFIHF